MNAIHMHGRQHSVASLRARAGRVNAVHKLLVGAVLAVAAVAFAAPRAGAMPSTPDQVAADEALDSWDLTEAEPIIARLNASAPQDPENLLLTGEYHLLDGDYQKAVEYFSQAVHAGADPLAQHYLGLATAVYEQTKNAKKHTTADGRFIISVSPGVDEILIPYTEEALAKAWPRLTKIFDFQPDRPIRIEFYPTVDVLGAVSPLTVAEIRTSGTIALCKYNRLMVTSPRDLVYGYDWLDTVAHELIHLIITKKSRNTVPIWLHEGLAKYYEVMWQETAVPKLERTSEGFLAKALANDTLISFAAMSPSMAKLPSQEATATAFAEVFTVIGFLNQRAGKDVAADLVALMAAGKSDRDAVSAIANLPFDRFERTWKGYLKQQGYRPEEASHAQELLFKGKHAEADELATIKIDKARGHVWLGDQMRVKKRWKAAAKEYTKAVTYVGDASPLVQGKLGYALLRLGRFEDAAAELEKPIALYPRHVILHVYLGQALLALGKLDEARAHLETAITINPFDPDVHESLALVYDRLGLADRAAVERRAQKLLSQPAP
ncbi:MAG: tetratricopeptide repeat protein [Myxococcales bacterium]|nr:tetratricopeptide repeat protein [Myxococcales bacterium]MCB9734656.1 tetratricopeptide repeat protein [Deltaproteobacteria bacterium]